MLDKLENGYYIFVMLVIVVSLIFTIYDWIKPWIS